MTRNTSRRCLVFESLERRRLLAAVDIPDDLTAAPAAIISVPVNIDSAEGVRSAEIRLSYDTALLDLDPSAIIFGSVWGNSSDTQVVANVDDPTGTVVIFVSASTPLGTISGSLVELSFEVVSGAAVGTTTVIDLTEVVLNEGAINLSLLPIVGPDATDGLLTITGNTVATDTITGFVYVDANNDSIIGIAEGIAGVTITLFNTATNTEARTVTSADGSYQFADVSAGTYRIVESQPIAYMEGGVNELTVTVTVGVSLTEQNFRESGLLPQFIYNRLLTTMVQPAGSTSWTEVIRQINTDAASGTIAVVGTATFTSVEDSVVFASIETLLPASQSVEMVEAVAGSAFPLESLNDEQDENESLDEVLASGLY